MLRAGMLAFAALVGSCAPPPAAMSASEASERLERFAVGADAMDVCTPQGRALLRGAVRAYGAELARAGVAWPALPNTESNMGRVDAAVVVAFASGMIEASDFYGPARGSVRHLSMMDWPQFQHMRAAAGVACADVMELQVAASRFVMELTRYQTMMAARMDARRITAQTRRMDRARRQMNDLAAIVQTRLEAERGG